MSNQTATTKAPETEGAYASREAICGSLASVRDRIALLADLFEGDGLQRRGDFSLSAHSADAVCEMLIDMGSRLDNAIEALSAD